MPSVLMRGHGSTAVGPSVPRAVYQAVYSHESLPEEDAYKIVGAIAARQEEIAWDTDNPWAPYGGIGTLGEETPSSPRDVPLHAGSVRWFREHGFKV
jgi:TRAP-type uncharacterized transport system substrate-binding protein